MLSGFYDGPGCSLSGDSKQLQKMRTAINKAASVDYPVIIQGDHGCEKKAVAAAIHLNGLHDKQRFVEIDCSATSDSVFERNLRSAFSIDSLGCIYLQSIDELSLSQQGILLNVLQDYDNLSCFYRLSSAVRLIASTTRCLMSQVDSGKFSRSLFERLSFLNILIPSLKERRQDIPMILEKLASIYRQRDNQMLSDQVISQLSEYPWPGNFLELEKTVATLMVFASDEIVCLKDLRAITPYVFEKTINNTGDIIRSLINKDYDGIPIVQPKLKSALIYISENYHRMMTLSELANSSCISQSHLSFLFKSTLGKSFKKFLSELRVARAIDLFNKDPNVRVTDVSLDSGFGDLSHFEKIFKRHVGMTPRCYKKAML